ncbi:flagellar hook-length control protein FliK [Marinobacter sp.]|uniref:flagellar hook-length control protein FliK n=1 Tax=Marinobacter sp. TaxID=50741 RepID=UPI002B495A28|nr:flagellar hook-length control protein FliK [Marinobacter sp.]HKK57406.1 flagellar hook-length control protein FliK [Marinobacter sp.]
MSQMVFPQNLPKSAPSEAASSSGSPGRGNEKSGESSFDAVSRSEQKRLDAREAKKPETAGPAEQNRQAEAKAAKSEAERRSAEAADAAKARDDKSARAEDSGEAIGQTHAADGEQSLEPDGDKSLVASPLTFADLQSLITPLPGQGATVSAEDAAASLDVQGLPLVQNTFTSMAGISGNGETAAMAIQTLGLGGQGKNASMTLQAPGQAGSPTAIALAESLLAGVTGDGGKASDTALLQNAIRFQGGLESVSAQANAVNTPKMAPDAPILRGYATSIELPVGHAQWGDKVAGKLTWLTARNMSVAEIHLTPPDMGPMEVKVQVQQEQANITVHSANPVVREQLELHSQRLRDMLSEQGIALENFDVSDSGSDQARDGDTQSDERPVPGLMADAGQEDMGAELRSLDLTWKGEVDIFA